MRSDDNNDVNDDIGEMGEGGNEPLAFENYYNGGDEEGAASLGDVVEAVIDS